MSLLTQAILLTALSLSFVSDISAARRVKAHRLAILIAAPWPGETAMHNDLLAVSDALSQRGYSAKESIVLEGQLNRQSLLALFEEVHRRIAQWKDGEVFLYFGGHGYYSGATASDARPGLLLASDPEYSSNIAVFWDEVFKALNVPSKVSFIILPDN
ncbi:MAG TPA: hypothetical protein VJ464_24095 [Blastocatellia bacterium]|nr:hypothetical protein [Blastocatellia bacterium]